VQDAYLRALRFLSSLRRSIDAAHAPAVGHAIAEDIVSAHVRCLHSSRPTFRPDVRAVRPNPQEFRIHETVKRLLARRSVDIAETRDLSRRESQIRHLKVLRANSQECLVLDR
jgi:hypothetical protein